MKFVTFVVALVATLTVVVATTNEPTVKTAAEALQMAKEVTLPDGVQLTDKVEHIDPPSQSAVKEVSEGAHKEQFWGMGGLGLGGLGGWGVGGWGNWGGWGGYGPYRYGFLCGGYPGWAYPLGYWNMYGSGLYGGGECGLACRQMLPRKDASATS
ncbi:hypothetical protein JM18_009806 [Phytophthora kernoviae]|uniref:Uncharacterized protein n=2 Tax=Phytophthora kernoviae TaxID=325452 RepID=A0A921S8D1_9STRA|nr:hypothetical protein G195_011723 [Phytophthora kernoviae 00238/432]KAG2502740.1 hypothetical protein JM18_009806 [Phytophthora kernoviae]